MKSGYIRHTRAVATTRFFADAQNDKRGDNPCGIDKIAYQVFLESIIRNLQVVLEWLIFAVIRNTKNDIARSQYNSYR